MMVLLTAIVLPLLRLIPRSAAQDRGRGDCCPLRSRRSGARLTNGLVIHDGFCHSADNNYTVAKKRALNGLRCVAARRSPPKRELKVHCGRLVKIVRIRGLSKVMFVTFFVFF